MDPLILPYALIKAAWASVVAYQRKVQHRCRILFVALSIPAVAAGMLVIIILLTGIEGEVNRIVLCVLDGLIGVYLASSIGVVVWAYRAKSTIEQRGFPIEPMDSVPPNSPDSV